MPVEYICIFQLLKTKQNRNGDFLHLPEGLLSLLHRSES